METGLKCCDCGSSKREINLGTGRCIMCECYVQTKRADAAEATVNQIRAAFRKYSRVDPIKEPGWIGNLLGELREALNALENLNG